MPLGFEQIHNIEYSFSEKIYIAVFGMPIVGLRIRARNIFALIPSDRNYDNILDAGSGSGVAWMAHVGGFVIGILLIKLMGNRRRPVVEIIE